MTTIIPAFPLQINKLCSEWCPANTRKILLYTLIYEVLYIYSCRLHSNTFILYDFINKINLNELKEFVSSKLLSYVSDTYLNK